MQRVSISLPSALSHSSSIIVHLTSLSDLPCQPTSQLQYDVSKEPNPPCTALSYLSDSPCQPTSSSQLRCGISKETEPSLYHVLRPGFSALQDLCWHCLIAQLGTYSACCDTLSLKQELMAVVCLASHNHKHSLVPIS